MKRMLFLAAAAALAMGSTGCVSIFYSHESQIPATNTQESKTRREVGLLGIPALERTVWTAHGLIPLWIETESNVK